LIPGTLLGLVALAAALGPGYLFVRRAERHHNRPAQSQLGELVEMVVIGGAASLLAAGIILGAARFHGFIDTAALREDAAGYLLAHSWRCFAAATAFYALAYGFAFVASFLIHRQASSAIEPGASGWTRAMRSRVPAKKAVRIMVELNDGRKLAGVVTDFSSAREQNREIVLGAPIVATIGRSDEIVVVDADFVALREDQIALLSGRYVDPD
jgi:Family of unknown function (DUF6338)